MSLPFSREHPGKWILQLGLWCRAGYVGLRSGGIFFVQVVYVMCESLVAARVWQVPLHGALASPKQPLSSSMGLGCHPPPPASWGNPTRGSRGWMQMLCISKETSHHPKDEAWSCLILSVLLPVLREAANSNGSWFLVCTGAAHTLCHGGAGPEAILIPGALKTELLEEV